MTQFYLRQRLTHFHVLNGSFFINLINGLLDLEILDPSVEYIVTCFVNNPQLFAQNLSLVLDGLHLLLCIFLLQLEKGLDNLLLVNKLNLNFVRGHNLGLVGPQQVMEHLCHFLGDERDCPLKEAQAVRQMERTACATDLLDLDGV